jgi:hypothetical protein
MGHLLAQGFQSLLRMCAFLSPIHGKRLLSAGDFQSILRRIVQEPLMSGRENGEPR